MIFLKKFSSIGEHLNFGQTPHGSQTDDPSNRV